MSFSLIFKVAQYRQVRKSPGNSAVTWVNLEKWRSSAQALNLENLWGHGWPWAFIENHPSWRLAATAGATVREKGAFEGAELHFKHRPVWQSQAVAGGEK